MSTNFETRQEIFLQLGVPEKVLPALKNYLNLLWQSNQDLNLISRQMSFADLIDNHLIDCLLPLKQFPKGPKAVADFGSGGGLPGVVYALLFPETAFHLYEKSPKKQAFLKSCQSIAANLQVHGEIPKDFGGVDLVMSRAFKPVDVILELSRAYYRQGGHYFLLKARGEKIEEELALARKKFKDLQVQVKPLRSPVLEVERNLVLLSARP